MVSLNNFWINIINLSCDNFQRNYYITLTIINLLSILLVSFMTFVIVHDRVFLDT